MTKTRKKIQTVPEEMRPAEAAAYTGISETYIYALLAHGVIPSRYERGRRLIRRDDLDAFLDRRQA